MTLRPSKPVLACFVGAQGVPDVLRGAIDDSVICLPRVRGARTWPRGECARHGSAGRRAAVATFTDIDKAAARAIVDAALAREEKPWLQPEEVSALLRAYGIPQPEGRLVHSPEEAAEACGPSGRR